MLVKVKALRSTWIVKDIVTLFALLEMLRLVYIVELYPVFQQAIQIIQGGLLALLVYVLLCRAYSQGFFLSIIVCLGILGLSIIASHKITFLKYLIIMLAVAKCDKTILYKDLKRIYLAEIIVVFFLGLVRILPSQVVRRGYFTFGFVHSNAFAIIVLAYMCCYILDNYKKMNVFHYAVLLCIVVLTNLVTDSRTATVVMLFLLMCTGIFQWKGNVIFRSKLIRVMAICVPLIMLGLSLFVAKNYDPANKIYAMVNTATNGRLWLAFNVAKSLDIPLLGQTVSGVKWVENSYIVATYSNGVIPTAIMTLVYMFSIKNSIKQKNYGITACLLCFAVHGLLEETAYNVCYNTAFLSAFNDTSRDNSRMIDSH